MNLVEPTRENLGHYGHNKRYSFSLRLWHWLNLIVISGSLITVLINSTITDDRSTSVLIQAEFKDTGVQTTAGQARKVAHALSDKVWGVHVYFGYALSALLLFRLVLELFQAADQKFIAIIKKAYAQFNAVKKSREAARHEFTVKLIYSVFFVLLIIMVVTGLFLAFEDALSSFRSIRHSVKEVHGFCMYLILAFITVHVAGVLLAERKDSAGIISDMVNGGRSK